MATHAGKAESITSRVVTPPSVTTRAPGPRGNFSGAPTGLGTASSGETFGEPRDAEGAVR